jgi:replicative DNA helicase
VQDGKPIDECLGEVESALLNIRANNIQLQIFHVKDFAPAVVDDLYRVKKRGCDLIGLTTGIQALDDATGGIRSGELWTVGALPGRGKTALGLQVAAANAVNCERRTDAGFLP